MPALASVTFCSTGRYLFGSSVIILTYKSLKKLPPFLVINVSDVVVHVIDINAPKYVFFKAESSKVISYAVLYQNAIGPREEVWEAAYRLGTE